MFKITKTAILSIILSLSFSVASLAADSKVTSLTEETTPVSTDILLMVDDPGVSPVSKKVQIGNLGKAISNMAPGANFTITQNSVTPFTSVNAGAVANTLYLNAGNVGINTVTPLGKLHITKSSLINDSDNYGIKIQAESDTTVLLLGSIASSYGSIQAMDQGISWTTRPLVLQPNGGLMGVGVSPACKLDVSGTLRSVGIGTPTSGIGVEVRYDTVNGRGVIGSHNRDASSTLELRVYATDLLLNPDGGGNVGIGTTAPNQKLTVESSMSLKEISAANADTAAYGQIWVGNSTPNELWFTDDAGTDTQLSSHPLDAPAELYTNGPGIDWMGKRVQKYLGIIFWQTLDGTVTEETFEAYNLRRKKGPGHVDLVKLDWDEVHIARLRSEKLKETIEEKIAPKDAFESVEIMEEIDDGSRVDGYEYSVDDKGKVSIREKTQTKKTKVGTGKFKKKLKPGISFNSKTGKFICKRNLTAAEVDAMGLKAPDMPSWMRTYLDAKVQ